MQERCFYCAEQEKFYCQVPSVSELSGRMEVSLNGQGVIRNSKETVDGCLARRKKEEELAELLKVGITPDWAGIEYIAAILEKAR